MTNLLIHAADAAEVASPGSKFGGSPSAPNGELTWPVCKCCNGNMQFLGQLGAPEDEMLLLLFMCANDPGMCDEWEPNGGGNSVIAVPATQLRLVQPPDEGETTRPTRYGAAIFDEADGDYDAARSSWASQNKVSPREVLGQLGGSPSWIQGDETPGCDSCGNSMKFFAQLEQGPDWQTEMNFGGGGCAYVFRCTCDKLKAKFLWQC